MTKEETGKEVENKKNSSVGGASSEPQVSENSEKSTEVETPLMAAKREAAENYDRFVRLSAEMENFKRRNEKERADLLKYGIEKLVKEMLPVLDSFEKALSADGQEADMKNPDEFFHGMNLVWKQLHAVLENHGLKALKAAGAKFDPNIHQAIQKIESPDIKEETIHDEYAKGYMLHDRLLRPSMVSVKVPSEDTK